MTRPLVALDFDGVLCDSAGETALSAWRAGTTYWPEWRTLAPDAVLIEGFLRLRPYLETGYQAIVMMRLLADGVQEADIAANLDEYCRRCIDDLGTDRQAMIACFGAARDSWLNEDTDAWLASHRFYPGTLAALRQAAEHCDIVILTTKQERFVQALLGAQGVTLPHDRVYGLDRGAKKTVILKDLLTRDAAREVHFVEDRAATLRGVVATPALESVRLYYASWGYGTSDDLAWAAAEARVTVWALRDFLVLPVAGHA